MPESLKTYRVTIGKTKPQFMTLQARSKDEARQLAERAQYRRLDRFPLTFARLDASLDAGDMDKAMHKAQTELRKRDQDRYDGAESRVVKVEEVK